GGTCRLRGIYVDSNIGARGVAATGRDPTVAHEICIHIVDSRLAAVILTYPETGRPCTGGGRHCPRVGALALHRLGHRLAQLHAPLVESVDAPDGGLG